MARLTIIHWIIYREEKMKIISILGFIMFSLILGVVIIANYRIKQKYDHHKDDDINNKLPKGVL